jgi:hypothetical protein
MMMMMLWWREPTWENSEPHKSSGPYISEIRSLTHTLMSPSFYLCNVCHAIFGNKAELKRHILTHSGGAKGGGRGGEEKMYSERTVPRGSRWW